LSLSLCLSLYLFVRYRLSDLINGQIMLVYIRCAVLLAQFVR
jgi:hypothetical protein